MRTSLDLLVEPVALVADQHPRARVRARGIEGEISNVFCTGDFVRDCFRLQCRSTFPGWVNPTATSRTRLELPRAGPGDRVAERDARVLDGVAAGICDSKRIRAGAQPRLLDEVVVVEPRDLDVGVALHRL